MTEATIPIPGPMALPLIGNLRDIDINNSIQSFEKLSETYGPIFRLWLGGSERIIICNYQLANELYTRSEFHKKVTGSMENLGKVIGKGILTAYHGDPSWASSRRTLNPAFTKGAIKEMFPEMLDIASQLVLKWARFGGEESIDAQDSFTRLSMDTIALCTMGTRFNSFYRHDQHPFVQSFGAIFAEVARRSNRPEWYTAMMREANRKHDENVQFVQQFCRDLVEERRANPTAKKDIFNGLVDRRDPVTGEQLPPDVIVDNMITFLFAGHDTTSGLLSFLVYYMIKHPDARAKLQEEVDRVLAKQRGITVDALNDLAYTRACLRETLRLEPPSPGSVLAPFIDENDHVTIGGGKYMVRGGQPTVIVFAKLHRDPETFGPDANEFKPERMSDDKFKKLPKHAWKAFGHAPRNCIGNEFAMQQATLVAALLFHTFDFELVDPEYTLQYQPSLHRKAKDLLIRATLRPHVDILALQRDLCT
ncbi:Cytochrome P450 [Rhypophila sp. PSN 637]